MAFSYDEAEYHEICNKICERAIRFVDNNLPEALKTKDVSMYLEIYIKVFRARSKMADDNISTTHDFQHLVSLETMMKHFLNMHECYEYTKVSYDFVQKEMVYSNDDEYRHCPIHTGYEGEYEDDEYDDESEYPSTDEDESSDDETDDESDEDNETDDNYQDDNTDDDNA